MLKVVTVQLGLCSWGFDMVITEIKIIIIMPEFCQK